MIKNRIELDSIKPQGIYYEGCNRKFYTTNQVKEVINKCANDCYYFLPLFLNKARLKIMIKYTTDLLNNEIDIDDFL